MRNSSLLRLGTALFMAATLAFSAGAADKGKLEKMQEKNRKKIEAVQKKANKRLEKVRATANKRIAKIMERAWGKNIPAEVPNPVRINPVPPVRPVTPDPLPDPIDRELDVAPVTPPVVDPKPQPSPLVEEDEVIEEEVPVIRTDVTLYGRKYPVAVVGDWQLIDYSPATIANQWNKSSASAEWNALAADVLAATRQNNLTGWAALEFTDVVARSMMSNPSSQAFLQTWLLVQLGYDARLANAGNTLYTMFGTSQMPMCNPERKFAYTVKDGRRYVFYSPSAPAGSFFMHDSLGASLKPVDLFCTSLPATAGTSSRRSLATEDYPEVNIDTPAADAGLLDFFSRYPRFSYDNGGVPAQWVNYALTPLQPAVRSALVEPLRQLTRGKSELDAVNLILSTVQDSFPYGYDDKIWGGDRPFFAQETLHYPLSDCEDHAILFTRLVKDVLGLPCALVYYPGHLAAAVEFSTAVPGDYIMLNGHRMTICDPTYYRPAGYTMPGMDNSGAQAVRF